MTSGFPKKNDRASANKGRAGKNSDAEDLELEKKWLQRAIVDLDNFAFFYDRYYELIYKYVFLRTSSTEATCDIVNETFSRALSGLSRFRWQGYTFGAWLFQIARTVMYKDHNDRIRRAEVPYKLTVHDQVDHRTPEKEFERLENEEILRRCVRQLSPVRQDVFVMHYWLELKTSAVAAALAIAEGTVKSHLQKGRGELLVSLQQQGLDTALSHEMLKVVRKADARENGWHLVDENDE